MLLPRVLVSEGLVHQMRRLHVALSYLLPDRSSSYSVSRRTVNKFVAALTEC